MLFNVYTIQIAYAFYMNKGFKRLLSQTKKQQGITFKGVPAVFLIYLTFIINDGVNIKNKTQTFI